MLPLYLKLVAQSKFKTAEQECIMLTKSHIKYITVDTKNLFPCSAFCAMKLEATSWWGYFAAIYWRKPTFCLKI